MSYFKFYLKGVQNALKIFYKNLKILVQKFATICIWKRSTFCFELELSLISKQSLKRKGLSWFQKCNSKRSLPKWFERVESYLIWFNSTKVLFQREFEHVCYVFCLTSKENGNWKLTLFISKVVLKLIWFDFRNPKRVHSKWFGNEVECFLCFLKSWKSLVWNRFQKNLSWFVYTLSKIWL